MHDDARTIRTLSALCRALTHKLRTPLSTISNELYYLQSLLPPDQCTRAHERVRVIADIVSFSDQFTRHPLVAEPCTLDELVHEAFGIAPASGATVVAPRALLNLALRALRESLELACEPKFEVSLSNTPCLTLRAIPQPRVHSLLAGQTFTSLTSLLSDSLDIDSLYPPFIDAALWASGAEIEISVTATFSLTVTWCSDAATPHC